MEIKKLSKRKGYACLVPDSLDDLWVLSEVIKPGDIAGKLSSRKIKLSFGDRVETDKKTMFLKIKVSETKFHEYSASLRISGEIVEGPDDIKGTHTFSLSPSEKIELWKNFGPLEMDMLKESQSQDPDVAFVLVDRDEAFISAGSSHFWIKSGLPSKRSDEEENYSQFFGMIKARLREIGPEYVVVAGPGFVKDRLAPELEYKKIVEGCSVVGEPGLREVVSRGVLERLGASLREGEEYKAVKSVLDEIHSGKAFYGMEDSKSLVEQGNADFLVVSSSLISRSMKEGTYGDLKNIIEKVKYGGGRVMLVGRNKDALSQLEGLGGIAGIRRWKR